MFHHTTPHHTRLRIIFVASVDCRKVNRNGVEYHCRIQSELIYRARNGVEYHCRIQSELSYRARNAVEYHYRIQSELIYRARNGVEYHCRIQSVLIYTARNGVEYHYRIQSELIYRAPQFIDPLNLQKNLNAGSLPFNNLISTAWLGNAQQPFIAVLQASSQLKMKQ
jgi:hypothetical protein